MPAVSIVVPAYNEEMYIQKLIDAILKQTFNDFELIIIDDCSTDKTSKIIKSYNDDRIKYIRNQINRGVTNSTNIGIKYSKGEYIFFTGADCTPLVNWIESGLDLLENNKNAVGVYGSVRYSTSLLSISDRIVETDKEIFGANMVFRKRFLKLVNGMNPEFNAQEDRDLAFRIKKYGEIIFSEDMIVIHQRKLHSRKTLFADAKRAQNMVYFIKKHQDFTNTDLMWRILYPKKLLLLLCPFLIIFVYSFRRWRDFRIGLWMYVALFYLRFVIWISAIKNRIFII
jgi:glycosyltransferase involved in cell wall biosynthesis